MAASATLQPYFYFVSSVVKSIFNRLQHFAVSCNG